MEELSVLLVEGDAAWGLQLMLALREWGYKVIGPMEGGEQLLAVCQQQQPDMVLMSAEPEEPFLHVATQLRQLLGDVPLVLLASEVAQQSFERAKPLYPAAYLPKEGDREVLRAALALAVHNQRRQAEQPQQAWAMDTEIFVRSRSRLVKLRIEEISWLGVEDAYTVLGTDKGKYLSATPLRVFEECLPPAFRRVHRSFIVNLRKVEGMEEGEILLGDKRIPLGRTYREAVVAYWPVL